MKLKVVAKPNGNVTFDVDNDSQFDGFDITIVMKLPLKNSFVQKSIIIV